MSTALVSALRSPITLQEQLRDCIMLTKPRIVGLIVTTALAGYYMADGSVQGLRAISTLVGVGLAAAGAGALNMYQEREADALMARTRDRPLPAGRLRPEHALAVGLILTSAGVAQLALTAHPLAAGLTMLTLGLYVGVYTPLKRRSSLCTLVGAVPGALPPLIGWAAAEGRLDHGAWLLFGVVFMWQLPHFLALAWLYRDDYLRAGFKMLPCVDTSGVATGQQAFLYSVGLLVAAVLPTTYGLAGMAYLLGATLLGLLFVVLSLRFARRATALSARAVFRMSLVHLPGLFLLMVFDKLALAL
jgi:protoheme IX farnesyltransferase